jgi:hypothetical protein
MYIPLDYWKRFELDACSIGPRGGRYVSFRNIGRKLSNSEFIPLVAGAWVGTTIPQSVVLVRAIRAMLELGHTVTVAIKSREVGEAYDLMGRYSDVNPLDGFDGE